MKLLWTTKPVKANNKRSPEIMLSFYTKPNHCQLKCTPSYPTSSISHQSLGGAFKFQMWYLATEIRILIGLFIISLRVCVFTSVLMFLWKKNLTLTLQLHRFVFWLSYVKAITHRYVAVVDQLLVLHRTCDHMNGAIFPQVITSIMAQGQD